MLGEDPPLPPSLIQELHDHTQRLRKRMSDRCWDLAADASLSIFEGWKIRHPD